MELFSYPENYRVWKARIVAQFNGAKLPSNDTDVELDGKANRTAAYLKINPFGMVPALKLEGNQGGVFESNSIARYAARSGDGKKKDVRLYGSNIAEASRIDGFLDAVSSLEFNVGSWSYKAEDTEWSQDYTPEWIRERIDGAKKGLAGFETALKSSPFLVGNSISLADIAWWCGVWRGFKFCFTKQFLADYPRCTAHFRKLEAMPEFQAVVKVKLPELERDPELKFKGVSAAGAALPERYHRIVTITDGKQSFKLKLYSENQAADIQETIRTRFGLDRSKRVVLVDQDGCDVIIDGTLETGKYTLQVLS
jgi:glutathione S-transferase